MAHFEHKSAATEAENKADVARNARYGLFLFALYTLFYGAFMLLNAFSPQTMQIIVFSGINLAVLYGLFLIAAAFLLALVYTWLCRSPADTEARR